MDLKLLRGLRFNTMTQTETALSLLDAGISVFPIGQNKVPRISWKEFIDRLPTRKEVEKWFSSPSGIGRVCGAVSGNLESIDFDIDHEAMTEHSPDSLIRAWAAEVERFAPGLRDRLCLIRTPRPGWHVTYRCADPVEGNQKLASVPKRDNPSEWKGIIETRGEGGYCLCPGSADFSHPLGASRYELVAGDLRRLPVVTAEERAVMLQAARMFDEKPQRVDDGSVSHGRKICGSGVLPGDDFERKTTWDDVLIPYGFTRVETIDGITYWRRPGSTNKWSASTNVNGSDLFYPFSPNCGVEPSRGYNRFSMYTHLAHGGDFARSTEALIRSGYGERPEVTAVDISEALRIAGETQQAATVEPFPQRLLHVPGIIAGLMDYANRTSFIRQPVLSLAALLAMLGTVIGRKVTDQMNTRANLYVVGLCRSGGGKEHARKVVKQALHDAGGVEIIGPEDFASGSGIVNAIAAQQSLLFQVDEIGRILRASANPQSAPHLYNVVTVLMKLFTSSNSIYKGAAYADAKKNTEIQGPNCNLYGTTVHQSMFEALTAESLTDGFVSRLLIFEGDDLSGPQRPESAEMPADTIEQLKDWIEFSPGGNVSDVWPQPHVIESTPDAEQILWDFTVQALAPKANNIEQTLWSRAAEKARKLALIYACSESCDSPAIGCDAAEWAVDLVGYVTRRTLQLAELHVSENDNEKLWKRLESVIKSRGVLTASDLHNATRFLKAHERKSMLAQMEDQGLIGWQTEATSGRSRKQVVWMGGE